MTLTYISLPLYSDEDYEYQISLEGNSYIFRSYYNNTVSLWYMDLRLEGGDVLLSGIALVPNYPLILEYVIPNLSGLFFLEPIETINTEKYKSDPKLISQYYRLFYLYQGT